MSAEIKRRSAYRASGPLAAFVLIACWCARALAVVFRYEGTGAPEQIGWQRLGGSTVDRGFEDGWMIQTFQEGGQDSYRRDIGAYLHLLVGRFFVEWRAITDNPEWLIDEWQTPAVLAAAGRGPLYHVVMTDSAVALSFLYVPRVIVAISAGEPHTYRIEVFADEYIWYIDGIVVDSGVPEGPYPDADAFVIWGAELTHDDAPAATTAWDYVRAGRIPDDASGNYDSDQQIALSDYYLVHDCLTKNGPGIFGGPDQNAGPGCRFTDFDADSDVDMLDFAEFANQFTGFVP